jgi:hypothetical protein
MDDVMMLMIESSCCQSATNRKWMGFFLSKKGDLTALGSDHLRADRG